MQEVTDFPAEIPEGISRMIRGTPAMMVYYIDIRNIGNAHREVK
jgi:hypothetical protein